MSASLSGEFNLQAFTDLGAPLIGGRLYTYTFGTTAHKTAYTDHAGTIPHTYTSDGLGGQYIALNARGELSAPLYLVGGSYDLSLKRADGSTVWTRRADPVWDLVSDLTASGGAAMIGFTPLGAGAVSTTVQSKLREFPSVRANALGAGDDTTGLQAAVDNNDYLIVPPGVFKTTGIVITSDKTIEFAGGSIEAFNSASRAFTIQSGATLTLINPNLKGYRQTDDSNKTSHGITVDNGVLKLEGKGTIQYWSGWGMFFNSGGSSSAISKISSGITVKLNGGGIETNDYEYLSIDGATITENGLNLAKTDWSNVAGASTGWGIHGRFANCSITNNTVNGNAIGIHLNALGGSNPDHNKIIGNTVSHNLAAGMILENLNSYETVMGNTCLSNVVSGAAPGVTFAGTGTSFDYIEVNCVGLQVIGNNFGVGSGGAIPIYGHGRCRYIGNNLTGASFTEYAHPQVGSFLRDFYGYDKNGDNLFLGNMVRNDSTAGLKPTILSDSVRTVVSMEIESRGAGAGSGGGKLIDGVKFKPTLINGWQDVTNGQKSWVSRVNGNQVTLYVYVKPTVGTGTTIMTLPAEYRPVTDNVQAVAAVGSSLAHSYGTVQTSGDVTIVGAVLNQPALLHVTYSTAS